MVHISEAVHRSTRASWRLEGDWSKKWSKLETGGRLEQELEQAGDWRETGARTGANWRLKGELEGEVETGDWRETGARTGAS